MARTPHRVEPIERFPVKPRRDGRFQKKIRGVLYYFGRDGNRPAALREYDRVKHDLYAGRAPRAQRPTAEDGASVRDLANLYIDDLQLAGEVTGDHIKKVKIALRHFVRFVGAGRVVDDLSPDDFASDGARLRKRLGGYAFNRERAAILAMFNHATAQDWIDRPPKYGKGFRRVPLGKLRDEKKLRLLSTDEVNALLGLCGRQMFAMILLGLNGGFGPTDCCTLTPDHIQGDAIVMRRRKTKIARTIPLWPETAWAIRRVMKKRPDDHLVFRTKRGRPWSITAVAHEFRKVVEASGADLPDGVGLYAARHTFATYANEVRDTDARRHIMGRKLGNLDDVYVEQMFRPRLLAVVNHVRSRLSIPEMVGDLPGGLSPAAG